jgi:Pyridoxal-dependent decarboxylase conserved domain
MPASTAGLLVGGGSAANLTALLVAYEAAGGPSGHTVLYVSDQAHSSLARTARAMGLRPDQVRVLPTDDRWRLAPEAVAAAVRADRRAGRVPSHQRVLAAAGDPAEEARAGLGGAATPTGGGDTRWGKPAWTRSPPPVSALARSHAPCASAMAATIDNPSPCPSLVPVRSAPLRWNGWKSRGT